MARGKLGQSDVRVMGEDGGIKRPQPGALARGRRAVQTVARVSQGMGRGKTVCPPELFQHSFSGDIDVSYFSKHFDFLGGFFHVFPPWKEDLGC